MQESYRAAWGQDIKDRGTQAWKDARASIHRIIRKDKTLHFTSIVAQAQVQQEGTRARGVIRKQIEQLRMTASSIVPTISEEYLDAYAHAHQPITDPIPQKPSMKNPIRSLFQGKIHPISHLRSNL
ncbi:MAG: hypothetical protein Q8R11_01275 [bacterium]|nr:hypothetical protein [bacterium]